MPPRVGLPHEFEPEEVWADISAEAKKLISKMMCKDVESRFTARESMDDGWFDQQGGQQTGLRLE